MNSLSQVHGPTLTQHIGFQDIIHTAKADSSYRMPLGASVRDDTQTLIFIFGDSCDESQFQLNQFNIFTRRTNDYKCAI